MSCGSARTASESRSPAEKLELGRGAAEDPTATIAVADAPTFAAVLTGQLPLDEALAAGAAQIEGGKQAAKRFLRLFPMPEPCACAGVAGEQALQPA